MGTIRHRIVAQIPSNEIRNALFMTLHLPSQSVTERSPAQSLVPKVDEEPVVYGIAGFLLAVLPDVAVSAAHIPLLRDHPFQRKVNSRIVAVIPFVELAEATARVIARGTLERQALREQAIVLNAEPIRYRLAVVPGWNEIPDDWQTPLTDLELAKRRQGTAK